MPNVNQRSSNAQPITLHPALLQRCQATALLGEAVIRYQVSRSTGIGRSPSCARFGHHQASSVASSPSSRTASTR